MLREELTSEQISWWMAYAAVEPFGSLAWRSWAMRFATGIARGLIDGIVHGFAAVLRLRPGLGREEEMCEGYMTTDVFGGLKALFGQQKKAGDGRP
jgi:hypothetical protein